MFLDMRSDRPRARENQSSNRARPQPVQRPEPAVASSSSRGPVAAGTPLVRKCTARFPHSPDTQIPQERGGGSGRCWDGQGGPGAGPARSPCATGNPRLTPTRCRAVVCQHLCPSKEGEKESSPGPGALRGFPPWSFGDGMQAAVSLRPGDPVPFGGRGEPWLPSRVQAQSPE